MALNINPAEPRPKSPSTACISTGQDARPLLAPVLSLPCPPSMDGHHSGHHQGHALNPLTRKAFRARYRLRQAKQQGQLSHLASRPGAWPEVLHFCPQKLRERATSPKVCSMFSGCSIAFLEAV